jgi:hypothetical protein
MSKPQNKSNDAPTTALVPDRSPDRGRWNEQRQQPSLENRSEYGRELSADWSSIAIVPSEPDCSTASIARALCRIGARLSVHPIEFLDANEMDLEGSSRLIARLGAFAGIAGPVDDRSAPSSNWAPPMTRTIVALGSPLANPLALPVSRAADAIVLCVRRGRDRIASVRDTIAALGPDRISCCALLDDAAREKTGA